MCACGAPSCPPMPLRRPLLPSTRPPQRSTNKRGPVTRPAPGADLRACRPRAKSAKRRPDSPASPLPSLARRRRGRDNHTIPNQPPHVPIPADSNHQERQQRFTGTVPIFGPRSAKMGLSASRRRFGLRPRRPRRLHVRQLLHQRGDPQSHQSSRMGSPANFPGLPLPLDRHGVRLL